MRKTLLFVFVVACGGGHPRLDRVRMQPEMGPLQDLVKYQAAEVDPDTRLIGDASEGLTSAEGLAFVIELEPQSVITGNRGKDVIVGTLKVTSDDPAIARIDTVPDVPLKIIFVAQKPGKTNVVFSHTAAVGTVVMPVTIVPQP